MSTRTLLPQLPTPRNLVPMVEDPKLRRKRLTERLKMLRERTRLIELELKDYTSGFFRVCIFGSARIKQDEPIYNITHRLAYLIGELGVDVLTGGGPGLMEAANKGVREGSTAAGKKSKSFGISIELNRFESPSEHLDIKHHHRKFSSRLDDFMRLSNVIVVTPGGIGTILELYFSWQLLQVGHMPDRPIILIGKEFWGGLIEWMKEVPIKHKLVSPEDVRWIHLVDTPEEALNIIKTEHEVFKQQFPDAENSFQNPLKD